MQPTLDGHFPHVHVGRMRGLGLGVVSALTTRVEVETTRDGMRWAQSFGRGNALTKLRCLGGTDLEGTVVRFRPDPTIFRSIDLEAAPVERRLQQLAWLLPHLRVFLNDRRLNGRGGVVGWAQDLAGARETTAAIGVEGFVEDVWVEIGIVWSSRKDVRIVSFANTLETPDGGTHVEGLWKGLASYARSVGSTAHTLGATRRALGVGLTAAVHVALLHPKFRNPCMDQLDSANAARAVAEVVRHGLANRLPYNEAAREYIHARLGVPRDAESTAPFVPADN